MAIAIVTTLDPTAGPRGDPTGLGEELSRLLRALPLLSVIFISIGGIYGGVFTPVEAADVGGFLVLVFAIAGRKLTRQSFMNLLLKTVQSSAMLYVIVIGAAVFSPFLALTRIPQELSTLLTEAGLGPTGTLFLIILGYILLGMFMDGISMLVVTLPIVFPIFLSLGFDPIWFGVIVVVVIEMGIITPPDGINVFVVKSIAPKIGMATKFRGILSFWLAMFVALILLVAFQQIALFSPNSMFQ